MGGEHTDTTARIVRILVDCGMVAREELELLRGLIQGAAAAKDRADSAPRPPEEPVIRQALS
jgi:hypothetical protein